MNKSVKTLAALAIGSLIVGANVPAAYAGEHADESHSSVSKDGCNGKSGCNGATAEHKGEKASCKGEHKAKDSCNGKDGCKAKSSCKGEHHEGEGHDEHAAH